MRRRLRLQEGANAVEFALVLPILVMLIFGAITAGLTLNAKQQLDHAAREGVRYAATLVDDSPACLSPDRGWHECVRDQVDGAAVGTVTIAPGQGGVCVSLIDDSGAADTMLYGEIEDTGGVTGDATGVSSNNPCFNESPSLSGPRAQVTVETPARLDAVLVRTDLFDLRSQAVSRYEEDE